MSPASLTSGPLGSTPLGAAVLCVVVGPEAAVVAVAAVVAEAAVAAGAASPPPLPPPPLQAVSRARPRIALFVTGNVMGPTIRRWRYGTAPLPVNESPPRVNVR